MVSSVVEKDQGRWSDIRAGGAVSLMEKADNFEKSCCCSADDRLLQRGRVAQFGELDENSCKML